MRVLQEKVFYEYALFLKIEWFHNFAERSKKYRGKCTVVCLVITVHDLIRLVHVLHSHRFRTASCLRIARFHARDRTHTACISKLNYGLYHDIRSLNLTETFVATNSIVVCFLLAGFICSV